MNCIQKQQLVSFPKVRIWKPWFRHFNNHKEFRNEGTVHLFSLMALFSYANFRSNERMISGERYMEAPGQWICKLGSLPRILRVHSKRQALEQLDYYEKYGFLTYEWLDEENEIIRFSITNWKEHCTSLQYNYYSYKGSGFFFFPLPVGRMLLRTPPWSTSGKPTPERALPISPSLRCSQEKAREPRKHLGSLVKTAYFFIFRLALALMALITAYQPQIHR